MSYILGLDLGTTTTAAATNDGETTRVFAHDSGDTVIPSVVALDEAGQFLVGSAAVRHGRLHPTAVAKEFKRRFGDTTPLLLRGTPVAANELTLRLATAVVDEATSQFGEGPQRLVVCHPANWGQFKLSLLADTLEHSTLPPHDLISEPHAAAAHYAGLERIDDGATLAVYDLGGGTFDVALLRKTAGPRDTTAPATTDSTSDLTPWELIGRPGGVERLGGIDFDAAIFHQIMTMAGTDLDRLDSDDSTTQMAVARLREECVAAKHLLSSENAVTVTVSLPGLDETVRLTRPEFEALIDPVIYRTLEALDTTLGHAGLTVEDLDRVLLVGGSSRIPLVGQRLASHTGRPLAMDAHPKHAVALGAAGLIGPTEAKPVPTTPDPIPLGANFPEVPHISEEPLPEFLSRRQQPEQIPTPARTAPSEMPPSGSDRPTMPLAPLGPPPAQGGPIPTADHTEPSPTTIGRRRWPWLAATLMLLAAAVVAALAYQRQADDGASGEATSTSSTEQRPISTTTPTTAEVAVPVTEPTNCRDDQFPPAETTYRVVEISDDDPDGGLNGREGPSVQDDVVLVFASRSPVKITGLHCWVDDKDRVWWGARASGELVWVAARFLEEL